MNIEKDLQKDGIIATEQVDTDTILKITKNIAKKIVKTFPNFDLKEDELFSKLFTLNMYKAQMPEGMAEANYCYKNSTIYFNSHISNEDLEEFAIHECIHFLQEVKGKNNKIKKMGLSKYYKFKTVGTGINEAAVQYFSAKIIGIKPDFEKYYNIDLYTPSPSYYPVICALLNELIFFVGEDTLFRSTFFSTDEFKKSIIKQTSKKVYESILYAFDDILNYEEKIITLKNEISQENEAAKLQAEIEKYRENINITFMQTQNLIIQEFFDSEYNNITNLEQLDKLRKKIVHFKPYLGITENYSFFENYYLEIMNKLEHKSNVLENGGTETALQNKHSALWDLLHKITGVLFYKDSY